MIFDADTLQVGDRLPELVLPPVSRATLALFAGASGDHNPIHIDLDYARAVGAPDVFAHGMLVMAWLGRAVTGRVSQERLRSFRARFVGVTQVGDVIHCSGDVREIIERNGQRWARIELLATDQGGRAKITGEATVALSTGGRVDR